MTGGVARPCESHDTELGSLERFDHRPGAPWLERFVSRRPLRNYGPLRLYACRRIEGGPECAVLVGRAQAAPEEARAALDRLAHAHARLDHTWIARVEERASAGDIELLVFAQEVASDLESLLALHARRSLPAIEFAAGEGWALGILGALEHAHARGKAMGHVGASNVLVDAQGGARVFGFGLALGPSAPGEATRHAPPPGTSGWPEGARDVCAWSACLRAQRAAFQRPEALDRAQRGQPLEGALAWLSHSVALVEHALLAGRTPLSAADVRAALLARHARLGVRGAEPAFCEAVRALAQLALEDEARASTSPGPGERYRFEGPLGAGATSTVLKAWDRQLRQHVAIKRLSAPSGAESVRRLLREVRTLREVRHPHLVRGYELYEDRGHVGAVMEYVPGPTLRAALAAGQLTREHALHALAQVADALSDLHRMGIVHRDVKPANVLLAPGRGAVLVDFGVATALERHGPGASATLTLPGQVLGEATYRAPELEAGGSASRASDVYALACTACEVLQLDRRRGALEGLHEPLRTCLARALGTRAEARPSALELAAALRADPHAEHTPVRQVALDGRSLTDADGRHVDLSKRGTLRRILAALAEAQHQRPGSSVSRSALFAAGWPGEHIDPSSAANRVYVAVAELRKLGLRGALESDGAGYALSTRAVRCVPPP